ncbi:hypothetical protein NPE20_25350 [Mucilaginibacter sp. JC4]|uniref:Uncharacterized protein n=1 Tax=Mucilaginibacter aquariorum TaxID=2967225 RepID=A0ABT1T9V4_9SPHI|nr:hypothetical protein [Mucilaginibacter aquariorum]
MNYLKFFKKAFLAVICLLLTNLAKAQVQDTTIYYYKQIGEGSIPVASADSADYFRIIPPFTPKDDLIEIKIIIRMAQ